MIASRASISRVAPWTIFCPGVCARARRAGGQPARRRAARPARPAPRAADVSLADAAAARGRGPADAFLHRGRRHPRGRRRQLRGGARRDARHRRRIRLRQERHRAVDHAPAAAQERARRRRARSASRAATCLALGEAEMRADPRQPHRHDLPGADDLPQSGAHDRRADRRGGAHPRGVCRPTRALARADGNAAAGAHSRRRSAASTTIRTSSPAACASA